MEPTENFAIFMNPFITPDTTLSNNHGFSLKKENNSNDDFFIDKKYTKNLTKTVPESRLRLFFLIAFLMIFFLICRVFYLQIIKGSEFYSIAEGNRIKTEIIPAPRGIFYDNNNKKLADNLPKFNLLINKNIWTEKKDNLNFINKIIFLTNLSKDEIIEKNFNQIQDEQTDFIVFDINYEKAMILKSNQNNYSEFQLQLSSQRKYYYENLSHTLGYLGKINQDEWKNLKNENYQFIDLIGKVGLEKFYENELRGKHGKIEYEVDSQGRVIKIFPCLPRNSFS